MAAKDSVGGIGREGARTARPQGNAGALTAARVPVDPIVAALTEKKGILVAKSTEQENCKAALKTTTQQAVAASDALYDEFSSRIDAVAGLVGKKTALGAQILKLRSDLLRSSTRRNDINADGARLADSPVTPAPSVSA